jgi:hypothetical protein
MPSSYTTRIRLEKQADGENANTWGLRLNDNVIDLVDEAVAGFEQIDVSAATSVELTNLNGQADQSRNFGLEFVGAISADVTVTMPAVEKIYFVRNNTTGDFNLMFKNTGGTAVTGVGQGLSMILATNGTSITTMEEADSTIFATVSALTATSAALNTTITNTSAALQSDINANTAAISTVSTAITTRSNQVSSTAESRIAGVSTVLSQTSSTLNTRINNVATSIASTNTRVTNTSATLDSRITSVSNNSLQAGTSTTLSGLFVDGHVVIGEAGDSGTLTVNTQRGNGILISNVSAGDPFARFQGKIMSFPTGDAAILAIEIVDAERNSFIIRNDDNNLVGVHGEDGTVSNRNGSYGTLSDESIKTSVTQLTGSLDKIANIQGSKFTKIGLAGKQVGFVAQNLQPHIPEVVLNNPSDNGLLSVNTMGLMPFLVEAVKELKAKVSVLENN